MMSWLPENVSTYGGQIDGLFYFIYYLTGAAFLLVHVALIAFIVLYRRNDSRRAVYSHGNTTLEIVWTVIPAIVFVALGIFSKPLWDDVKRLAPPSEHQVRVTAKQFNWDVQYPGPDKQFDTGDDVTLENDLNVPVNTVIHVHLRSKDVIHSFFVPQFRLKQDSLPGREILAWFEATKPGKYEMPCAELCGFGHSGMKGWVTVHAPADYETWSRERWPQASAAAAAGSPAQGHG
jgi:cytochrome c oxidase subunit 2